MSLPERGEAVSQFQGMCNGCSMQHSAKAPTYLSDLEGRGHWGHFIDDDDNTEDNDEVLMDNSLLCVLCWCFHRNSSHLNLPILEETGIITPFHI